MVCADCPSWLCIHVARRLCAAARAFARVPDEAQRVELAPILGRRLGCAYIGVARPDAVHALAEWEGRIAVEGERVPRRYAQMARYGFVCAQGRQNAPSLVRLCVPDESQRVQRVAKRRRFGGVNEVLTKAWKKNTTSPLLTSSTSILRAGPSSPRTPRRVARDAPQRRGAGGLQAGAAATGADADLALPRSAAAFLSLTQRLHPLPLGLQEQIIRFFL